MHSAIGVVRKPFRVLALGDSVMWGQGLFPQEKIHQRVADEIQRLNPHLRVRADLLAHSGSIIGDPDDPPDAARLEGAYSREVPIPHPTVFQQVQQVLRRQRRSYAYDLILVCAGINDVHLKHLLNPADDSIEKRMIENFYTRLKALMETLAIGFPKAEIIICGYYPFFSTESQRGLIALGMAALGFAVGGVVGALGGFVVNMLTVDEIITRSDWFVRSAANATRAIIGELAAYAPEWGARLHFVDPGFTGENAMFAPKTLLYGINLDLSPQDPREIAQGRARACEEHSPSLDPLERFGCPKASVGHPTPQGAERYASAILRQTRVALPVLFAENQASVQDGKSPSG
jgi:lysophospholipase L1-like esterase